MQSRVYAVTYPDTEIIPIQNMQVIWAYLLAHSDEDTVERLIQDPAARPDARKVTIELNADGTRGFSLTIDQMIQGRTFWIPSLDVYISTGDSPVKFADAQHQLAEHAGARMLDRVERDPEPSYDEFKAKWGRYGEPHLRSPGTVVPGHIVCLTWDSAIHKFGVDRGAGVWNDYGNPDRFRFWFEFGNLAEGITSYWKSQTLNKGLPVITTDFVRDNVRYEVEQFAYPLHGPPPDRQGDMDMVLLQRVRLSDLSGKARTVSVTMVHERGLPSQDDSDIVSERLNGRFLLETAAHHDGLLAIDPKGAEAQWVGVKELGPRLKDAHESGQETRREDITLQIALPANGTREFTVALPSPSVTAKDRDTLTRLDYDAARDRTIKFWSDYLAQGAQFEVPEGAVNDLFRANLWHALVLPRRQDDGQMDLPYSNFAYSQTGTPWPVNQAVYVDYMIYSLRGYDNIAAEEIQAIYRNNQGPDGHLGGNANWLAYTPGMLYAVAEDYLVSDDRASFEQLLPETH